MSHRFPYVVPYLRIDQGRRFAALVKRGKASSGDARVLCVTNSDSRAGKMVSQFTHRQDSMFSHTSICVKCFRVVATRERESELRADEAIHSCGISLPGAKPDPTYWGIICRTCAGLVAFGKSRPKGSGPGADNSKAGTIRCSKGHSHIYFPRDFRLFPSAVAIADVSMLENFETYKAINPFRESSSEPLSTKPSLQEKCESTSDVDVGDEAKESLNLVPDTPRQIANRAAKERWASWELKKTLRLQ